MTKILILGTGAREHCIAETFKRSKHPVELFTYGTSKNPGLLDLSSVYEVGSITDLERIRLFAKSFRPDFVFPGPEAPIAAGVVDVLAEEGFHSVAPRLTVARLESSKGFTRELLKKYHIPGNPLFKVFYSDEGLDVYLRDTLRGEFVIKSDGLKGGKGVKVVGDHLADVAEGLAYARECLAEDGRVVIEEKFIGEEFSLMSFVDGTTVLDTIPAQDHKRAYVGDKGPNTGGMGSYSDSNHLLPFLTPSDLQAAHDITVQVAQALLEETGTPFQGIMYGGFMAVRDGVRLIEYNARMADPETMNVLPLLENDFVDLCQALIRRELSGMTLQFKTKATVCKYVVPKGYPDEPVKHEKIEIGALPQGATAYFASVDQREDGLYLGGSRAVAILGVGETLTEAEQIAQEGALAVKGPVFFREDIGTASLLESRIQRMTALRA